MDKLKTDRLHTSKCYEQTQMDTCRFPGGKCKKALKSVSILEDCKEANITPIFKKASRGDYRMDSLMLILRELVGSIIKD